MQILLSTTGFLILNIALIHYFAKLKKSQTPKKALFLKFGMLVSSALSIAALVELNYLPNAETVLVVFLAFFVLSTSATFSYFLATKDTPIGDIKVKEGDTLLPFSTDNFDSQDLIGKRTLLKFYRGSWCPYCSAELVMFENMKPELNKYQVQVVAVSNDTRQEQAEHIARDKISHTLVSDPELEIIRQYGVEHHKGLGATAKDSITVFGMPMPLPWKMKHQAMSIPTTLLINEVGKIVWIDQSEDYRLRASEEAILGALSANFETQNVEQK